MKQVDIEQVLDDIRDDVAKKRMEGSYPPGLEQELEAEFKSILSLTKSGLVQRSEALSQQLERVRSSSNAINGLTPINSRLPGFSFFHRVVRKLTARPILSLASQMRVGELDKIELLELLVEQSKAHEDADDRLVLALSKHVLDRLAVVDHLAILIVALETKIRSLEEQR